MAAAELSRFPLHLDAAGGVVALPEFRPGDLGWYADYEAQSAGDGIAGRLVSQFTFTAPWDSWEMHPHGAEVVVCVAGAMVLIQEIDGQEARIALGAGEYAVNPPGVWHTADIDAAATAVFITAGLGTAHRPRSAA